MPSKLTTASALLLAWTNLGTVRTEAQSGTTKPTFAVSIDRSENGTIRVNPPQRSGSHLKETIRGALQGRI